MAKAMQPQKMRFSQAIQTPMYKNLVNNTLGDPARGARFIANITSAVAVNPELQKCDAGTILAGACRYSGYASGWQEQSLHQRGF